MDGIQYLHRCFTSIYFVENLVDLPVRPLPDGLDDFPGVSGIWKVVKDDGFPRLWKHLQERSPAEGQAQRKKDPSKQDSNQQPSLLVLELVF